jgi:glyoxylase-like metal-dependent hydrolase (beta-lactamase superfamily II)
MVRGVPAPIDLMHRGLDRVIGAYDVDGVVVDPGPASCVDRLLAAVDEPRALLLTHIHLDHAGASGVLVRRFPHLKVYVHERGAPHMIDPSRLLASARKLYGDEMDALWGEVAPVPEENVHVLEGGETVEGFKVAYTPGHASHHVSYLHESTGDAYVGDVGGVRIPPSDLTLAPTPPPDIDLEAWRESLDKIAAWSPERLCLTHFGTTDRVDRQLDRVRESTASLAERVRGCTLEEFQAALRDKIAATIDDDVRERLELAVPFDHIYLGLERYWRKREERDAA